MSLPAVDVAALDRCARVLARLTSRAATPSPPPLPAAAFRPRRTAAEDIAVSPIFRNRTSTRWYFPR